MAPRERTTERPPEAPRFGLELVTVQGGVLFVFGWMLERSSRLIAAAAEFGPLRCDLTARMARFERPDISAGCQPPLPPDRQQCGLMIASVLPEQASRAENFVLELRLEAGEPIRFAVQAAPGRARFLAAIGPHRDRLQAWAQRLPEPERAAIERALEPQSAPATALADPARPFGVDTVWQPRPGQILVAGWLSESLGPVSGMGIAQGGTILQPNAPPRFAPRRDVQGVLGDRLPPRGFVLSAPCDPAAPVDGFALVLHTATGVVRHPLVPQGPDAILQEADANTRLLVLEEAGLCLGPHAHLLHAAWRQAVAQLPEMVHVPEIDLRCCVDSAVRAGQAGVVVSGWVHAAPDRLRVVHCRTAAGASAELSANWIRGARPDVWRPLREQGAFLHHDDLGYTCFARLPVPAAEAEGYLELRDDAHTTYRLRFAFSAPVHDPIAAVKALMGPDWQGHRDVRRLMDLHIGPAVASVWNARPRPTPSVIVTEHGPAPEAPRCSVVVPVYGRADFIEHQLNAFADDPAMRAQELIYVIDDPELYEDVRRDAPDLAQFYEVPFRLAYAGRNGGYAAATNFGSLLARGEYLLLMNSDVLPDRPGWLPALLHASAALPNAGAVGPKLLYEDGSIQHAGMRFMRLPVWGGMWVNDHPGKGQPDFTQDEPIEAQAITGACLLIRRALYQQVGGLSEDYIIGDFEDSDLCLKLLAAGRRNWVVPSVTLYHLERQTQNAIGDTTWRANLSLYNCWTHTNRWDAAITRLAGQGAR